VVHDDGLSARCDELAAVWATWAAVLRDLPAAAWRQPTRLDGWDVAALVAHHGRFPGGGLQRLLEQATDSEPTVASAAALLARFNEPGGAATTLAAAVADQARDVAASTPSDALVEPFTVGGPATIAALRAAGNIVVDYFGHGRLQLADVCAIAVLEATVHLLDLQHALDVAPAVPDAALRTTATLLAQVADPVRFIEAATGRSTDDPLPVIR